MIATLHWTAELDTAPRARDVETGLRDAACFAQDLAVAVSGPDPLTLAVIHVGRADAERMRLVAERLEALPGFAYRTGPDTVALIAPGTTDWEVLSALQDLRAAVRPRIGRRGARIRAGIAASRGRGARELATAALGALAVAVDGRASVALD